MGKATKYCRGKPNDSKTGAGSYVVYRDDKVHIRKLTVNEMTRYGMKRDGTIYLHESVCMPATSFCWCFCFIQCVVLNA